MPVRLAALLACSLLACRTASPKEEERRVPPGPLNAEKALHPRSTVQESAEYVQALRDEYRALGRIQRTLSWYTDTQGETSLGELTYVGHDRLFQRNALDQLAAAEARPGLEPNEAKALRFLRRALAGEIVALSTAKLDDEYADTEASATVKLPWQDKPVAYRDVSNLIAQEKDVSRRQQAYAAVGQVITGKLNPILEKKEEAAQRAARETGFPDYVALSEELRQVRLEPLLQQGIAYIQGTSEVFPALLDRIAREELGVGREALRSADIGRLFKSPRLAAYFDRTLETKTLLHFLSGIGLDLRSAKGTQIRIDDALHPQKRPRAFMNPIDAPADVRLSVKPTGGLDDYGTLFHEAGHAVHYANATIEPKELVDLGYGAPTEAYGEFFRYAFSDPRWLVRYRAFLKAEGRPTPTNQELAAVLRRTALLEMYLLRRYAFAKVAYELRLHGRPLEQIAPALALVPRRESAATDLRELYRQLFSVAYTFELNDTEAQRYRADVDDTFYSADYARAFVLAGMMHDAVRSRFGADWYANHAVGQWLKQELFAAGASLSSEDVANRLGAQALDFAGAARRARRLVEEADALEKSR